MVAGSRGGNSNGGLANAGAAVVAGPQEMIRRTLISYVRQQEENADRAGVKFSTPTGQSAKACTRPQAVTNDSLFAARGADPYVQSHPMPAERVAALEEMARSSPYWDKKDDPATCSCDTTWSRQDLGVHGAAGHRLPALIKLGERRSAGALRARDHDLPARRFALRARPDRRADPRPAQ